MLPALLLIAAVAVLAIILRASAGKRDETVPRPPERREESGAEVLDDEEPETDEDGFVEAAAVTSDGWAFVPRGSGLELVPPGEEEDLLLEQAERHGSDALKQAMSGAPINPHTGRRLVYWKPGEPLGAGDLIAARVVRGAPEVDPWRLEALGRDYDYRAFAFETEEAARTALALVDERVVRPPRDEHGDAVPVGAEDFAVARRQHEETEQALAMEQDEEREP
jgi:hypothetical protein